MARCRTAVPEDPSRNPSADSIKISDDQIRESLEGAQLRLQRERGIDVTFFSPIAGQMAHHIGNAITSQVWSMACNDLIYRVTQLYPDKFVGVCQLPQSPRGLARDMKRPPLSELLMKNLFFDTCVYHLPGIELLTKVIPTDNILFATEMVGAVKGIDPETGFHYDDTKRYIDQVAWLTEADRAKIFEGNARKVYPRVNPILDRIAKIGQ